MANCDVKPKTGLTLIDPTLRKKSFLCVYVCQVFRTVDGIVVSFTLLHFFDQSQSN